ncbi:eukaryotic elongation factor 2 kinase-like isoform X1 [Macrobrachium nipponense]|uniref:eukaryotic elongation factor 2 kinase-like isoform X1 n=1 Tax=Macrobrachium nipponense TaxID=159736 RepID=UPI0030C8D143
MVLVERSMSECSDDIDIRPLELGDLQRRLSEREETQAVSEKSDDGGLLLPNDSGNRFFSAVFGIVSSKKKERPLRKEVLAKMRWKSAIMKARNMGDPWEKFHLDTYKTEKAKRHRYNAKRQCWVVDEVVIKMEEDPFNHGAMRECYRLKKLSNFQKDDWVRAHNYVAKRYMDEETPRSTYFEDVRLQMDAKLWGEEFNRHNPPKKVDIFQMAILEMIDREGSPLYHLEHFIEGNYVKYNSNSGFVKSDAIRMTPQAFSHFTFERSGHSMIVVDIQGVGDLYTDPQIHTSRGDDYGDGNLGTRGMALFLHSHRCNSICQSLGLTAFDLAPSEMEASKKVDVLLASAKTIVRGTEEMVVTPVGEDTRNIQEYLRTRSLSSGYMSGDDRPRIKLTSISSVESYESDDIPMLSESEDSAISSAKRERNSHERERQRYDSMSEFGSESSTASRENELCNFREMVQRRSRPSHVLGEIQHRKMLEELEESKSKTGGSILGQIHLDLAKYHELNRFVEESETYDHEAALYHLNQAAKCGILEAIVTVAYLHMGLPHNILPDIELDEDERDMDNGFNYLLQAAQANDRGAMIHIAKIYDTGIGLPEFRTVDWKQAVFWYDKVVNTNTEDEEGNFDATMDDPQYQLIAREATMYWQGGNGLDKDPYKAGELFNYAAELATEAMKGKLASKYYMQAEEAWAECDEE